MSETTRAELDTSSQAKLGVTRELRVGSAVVEELVGGESALESREKVLGSDTVTSLVVEGLDELVAVRAGEKGEEDGDLWDSVVGSSGVPRDFAGRKGDMSVPHAHCRYPLALLTTPGGAAGSEEDDGITKNVNVLLQALLLLCAELGVLEGERDRLVLVKRDRELLRVKVFELERHVGH